LSNVPFWATGYWQYQAISARQAVYELSDRVSSGFEWHLGAGLGSVEALEELKSDDLANLLGGDRERARKLRDLAREARKSQYQAA
jgi:hypothetical protein